uniref:Uncharacterized protein n=1 Tax=Pseudomonas phage Touem01 TaxID=3138548 RepID=A0AAU6W353_9VIRU
MIDLELQKFISHTTNWHTHQIGLLQRIIDAPEGTPIKIGENQADEIVLTGERSEGFRVAIHVVMVLLGKLPFHIEAEGADEVPASLKDVPGLQVIDTASGLPKQ